MFLTQTFKGKTTVVKDKIYTTYFLKIQIDRKTLPILNCANKHKEYFYDT